MFVIARPFRVVAILMNQDPYVATFLRMTRKLWILLN